jgi:hypothetical protein
MLFGTQVQSPANALPPGHKFDKQVAVDAHTQLTEAQRVAELAQTEVRWALLVSACYLQAEDCNNASCPSSNAEFSYSTHCCLVWYAKGRLIEIFYFGKCVTPFLFYP